MSRRIAIVEDDADQRRALAAVLADSGDRCATFADASSFLKGLQRDSFDLACIDWTLPDLPGTDLVARIRAGTRAPELPMILITARDRDGDIVTGLKSGADDYVIKPVNPEVLRARVAAVLRRTAPDPEASAELIADVTFDASRAVVTAGGEERALTAKEFNLARLLFRNLHRPLARSYLMEEVWGHDADVTSRTLDTHVCRLRTKLDLTPSHGFNLGPVYGYGYRLERTGEGHAQR